MRTASKKDKETLSKRIGAFLQQYRRRSQKGQEPNDRGYDREIEQYLRKLRPEEVDVLINDRANSRLGFAHDDEIRKIPKLAEEFFRHILDDEDPLFVSDEAKIWDLTLSPATELVDRCSRYYGTTLSESDLDQPLWKLIKMLDARRTVTES